MWQKHYQGTGDNSDRFNKIISDGQGNFIAAGYSIKTGNYRDFLTVKFDSNGDTLWWATKNGKGNADDEATQLAIDALGNIYVAGYSDGGKSEDDILLIKYNSNGVRQWDTTWNSPAWLDDVPNDMAIDANGNIFITGNAEPDTVTGSMDYITLKFSPAGAILWQVQYSRPGVTSGKDEATALALDAADNCFVTGRSSNGTDDDMITFKYDGSNGSVLFTQIYNGGSGDDRGVDIAIDNNQDIIVTGRSDNGSNQDIRTLKYSTAGGILWSKFYNGASNQNDRPVKIIIDATNNVYIAGESDVDNSSLIDYDYVLLKYNSGGTLQWARTVGSNAENDHPSDLAFDSNGDIIITGKADMNTNLLITDNDFMTVKYNPAGAWQWTKFHSGTRSGGSDIASAIVTDGNGNSYVAGGSENTGTQKDATVVKYDVSGNVTWFKNYNGEGDFSESGRSIVIDANDNAFVGGYTFREGHNRDILLVKLLPSGDTVCTFTYDGTQSDDDELVAVARDASGNVYATGYTKNIGQKSDMFTMKFNPATCDTMWTRTFNHSTNQSDKGEAIVVDAAGNVYVTGRSDSNPNDTTDNDDIVTFKYDTNGNQIWMNRFNGIGNLRDEPSRIQLDNSGNVLVCGRTEKVNDDDFVLLKYYASNGSQVWSGPSLYNGPFANDDRALDMTIDAFDNIFVCGYSQTGSGTAPDDAAVVKFDSSGAASAFYFFDGIGLGTDQALAITHDNLNQVYVTFRTDVDPNPLIANYDYLTMKFDNDLNPLWPSPPTYNGPIDSDDIPVAITTNAAGYVFVTGYSKNDTLGGRTNIDWVTIRYDSLGLQSQIHIFDGALGGDDEPNAMALRGSTLWVTGFSIGNGNNQKDVTTIRFDLSNDVPFVPMSNDFVKIYPNPFTDQATLEFNPKNISSRSVMIFDILGNLVHSVETDQNKVILNKESFSPGMYFFRISESSEILNTGKFIVK
jgi:uncharacterized delta-60 repeat protein